MSLCVHSYICIYKHQTVLSFFWESWCRGRNPLAVSYKWNEMTNSFPICLWFPYPGTKCAYEAGFSRERGMEREMTIICNLGLNSYSATCSWEGNHDLILFQSVFLIYSTGNYQFVTSTFQFRCVPAQCLTFKTFTNSFSGLFWMISSKKICRI